MRAYSFGDVYGLVEGSLSQPQVDDPYYSVLGETQLALGSERRHLPYYRIELATRPEFEREGARGTNGFFRYHHDDPAIGATRWLINTGGYNFRVTSFPTDLRAFVEIGHHHVRRVRGPQTLEPQALFGTTSFWSASIGLRLFLGGGPMRMGAYGVLDAMTVMHRPAAAAPTDAPTHAPTPAPAPEPEPQPDPAPHDHEAAAPRQIASPRGSERASAATIDNSSEGW